MEVEMMACVEKNDAFIEHTFGRKSFEYLHRCAYSKLCDLDKDSFVRKFVNPDYIMHITECKARAFLPVFDSEGNFVREGKSSTCKYRDIGEYVYYEIKMEDGKFLMLEDDFVRIKKLLGIVSANMTDAETSERDRRMRIEEEEKRSAQRTIAALNGSCT